MKQHYPPNKGYYISDSSQWYDMITCHFYKLTLSLYKCHDPIVPLVAMVVGWILNIVTNTMDSTFYECKVDLIYSVLT